MGVLVMVIGKSGSGKSSSLRNFENQEIGIFNVASKPLPFKKALAVFNTASYETIMSSIKANTRRAYAIDDSTYLMQFSMFDRAKEKGYDKFTDMAVSFKKLLDTAAATSKDTIVYFLHHPQFGDDGAAKPQTVGKMLDNQLNIEGLFPIVLECTYKDGEHVFVTNNDGFNIAKSPVDLASGEAMLPPIMPNDLKLVDTCIRTFWGLAPLMDHDPKH